MSIVVQDVDMTIMCGDALKTLLTLDSNSVRCCVTSPPYWGLRDYGNTGQIGLEETPDQYVENLVAVFAQVRRLLTFDGTLWLNLGDSYAGSSALTTNEKALKGKQGTSRGTHGSVRPAVVPGGLKPKDLVGIPWRVAFALQADGWYLRSDIIWAKTNPMPESIGDRPTKSHEYVFLLSKSQRYFYDAEAIAERATYYGPNGMPQKASHAHQMLSRAGRKPDEGEDLMRNCRDVWPVTTQPYADAHFAVFPEEIPRRCILAGSERGDTVLDPFAGSGTTGLVARNHGRRSLLIELNLTYAKLAAQRCAQQSLLALEDA